MQGEYAFGVNRSIYYARSKANREGSVSNQTLAKVKLVVKLFHPSQLSTIAQLNQQG